MNFMNRKRLASVATGILLLVLCIVPALAAGTTGSTQELTSQMIMRKVFRVIGILLLPVSVVDWIAVNCDPYHFSASTASWVTALSICFLFASWWIFPY